MCENCELNKKKILDLARPALLGEQQRLLTAVRKFVEDRGAVFTEADEQEALNFFNTNVQEMLKLTHDTFQTYQHLTGLPVKLTTIADELVRMFKDANNVAAEIFNV